MEDVEVIPGHDKPIYKGTYRCSQLMLGKGAMGLPSYQFYQIPFGENLHNLAGRASPYVFTAPFIFMSDVYR